MTRSDDTHTTLSSSMDDFEYRMGSVIASQRLEGMDIPPFCLELIGKCIRGEMKHEQAIEIITERVRQEYHD